MKNYKKTISAILVGMFIGLIPTYGIIFDNLTNKTFNIYKSIYFLTNFLTPIGGVLLTEFILFATVGAIVTCFNKKRTTWVLLLTSFLINYVAYLIKAIMFSWNVNFLSYDMVLSVIIFFVYMWVGGFLYSKFRSNSDTEQF